MFLGEGLGRNKGWTGGQLARFSDKVHHQEEGNWGVQASKGIYF